MDDKYKAITKNYEEFKKNKIYYFQNSKRVINYDNYVVVNDRNIQIISKEKFGIECILWDTKEKDSFYCPDNFINKQEDFLVAIGVNMYLFYSNKKFYLLNENKLIDVEEITIDKSSIVPILDKDKIKEIWGFFKELKK